MHLRFTESSVKTEDTATENVHRTDENAASEINVTGLDETTIKTGRSRLSTRDKPIISAGTRKFFRSAISRKE